MRTNTYTVKYRRKRQGKTNYKKRLALVASNTPRLVVRKSLTKITTQIISYNEKGDVVQLSTTSKELEKQGWKGDVKNIPAAYLTGYVIAKKALAKGVKKAIFDIGLQTPHVGSKIYAVLKGAVDGGLDIPHTEDVFPTEDRINGTHIKDFKNNIEEMKAKIQ